MKNVVCVIALFAALPAGAASSGASRLDRIQLYGSSYVRLSDWAQAQRLDLRWTKKDEIQLTNSRTRIVFTVDSRKAEVNGVSVSLSLPVAAKNGACYIAPLDLQTTLQPVLYPPKNRASKPVRIVCLDAGHGGKDPGNIDGRQQEKHYTLLLAEELRELLLEANLKVVMTRTGDRFVERPTRSRTANKNDADVFVSLHFNAADSSAVKGVEVYCMTPAGASSTNARGEGAGSGAFPGNRNNDRNMLLAYTVQRSLVRRLPTEDRGVHRARFQVLREVEMPAILVEGGFMSHPLEGKKLTEWAYRRQMAKAIAEGIIAYKKTVEG